ncbi:Uma2 family endonuclease [Microcoleus sp. PH2017_35_SFW_U_B]|uniref:Uma2 family endonuclease n=1 Tax=Microcoleus sp. PH2017_35_SFW_U_B TaxID=2798845 RepID=UPI001D6DD3AC|nr:Uma2 family endonuclease [Microcoleus sp. PH2017_35_SFW_U_B]MCC3555393.1 Uma2 family endonuclease [Microcoleus sp. PH2017_35_SFW_U_B]
MAYTAQKILTFEAFVDRYCDNPRYELADGELVEVIAIAAEKLPWFIPRTCLIRPFSDAATARRPDIVVLDETALISEPLWEREPVITLGRSIKLAVEVVSTNWETDYARKVEEYALLGIPEYWIVDYRGLGGLAFIGKPKQPTVTVCQLIDQDYAKQQFRMGERIISPLLKNLELRLDDILPR